MELLEDTKGSLLHGKECLKDLKLILTSIIQEFMSKLHQYPMMFIEILFSKNSYDCKYIELGEDPVQKSLADPMEEMKVVLCVDPSITSFRDKISIVATRLIEKSQGFMMDWAVNVGVTVSFLGVLNVFFRNSKNFKIKNIIIIIMMMMMVQ